MSDHLISIAREITRRSSFVERTQAVDHTWVCLIWDGPHTHVRIAHTRARLYEIIADDLGLKFWFLIPNDRLRGIQETGDFA